MTGGSGLKLGKWADLRYLGALILPAAAFAAFALRGPWSILPVLVAFVGIPAIEAIVRPGPPTPSVERERLPERWFDGLLLINLPIVAALVVLLSDGIAHRSPTTFEAVGWTIGTGVVLGSNGINVAHELGHRGDPRLRFAGRCLLLPCLYLPWQLEHNRGHHRNVGTPDDPATARRGESLYRFLPRAVTGTWRGAWHHGAAIANRQGKSSPPWRNPVAGDALAHSLYLGGMVLAFGLPAGLACLGAGCMAILMLETIDYIEHYGLERGKTAAGTWRRPGPECAWNSDHALGRIVLFELTRHSDHHVHAGKQWPELQNLPEAPTLPSGYPACMLLATVPWAWFRTMDRRIPATAAISRPG